MKTIDHPIHPVTNAVISDGVNVEFWPVFVLKWSMKKEKFIKYKNGEHVISPLFNVDGTSLKWELLIYPGGHESSNDGFTSYYIRDRSDDKQMPVYKLCVENDEQTCVRGRQTIIFNNMKLTCGWSGYHDFFPRDDILNSTSTNIIFRAEVSVPHDIIPVIPVYLHTSFHQSSSILHKLYQNQSGGDIEIITKNGNINAHSYVLAAGSDLLGKSMKENQNLNKIVNLRNFGYDTVSVFVRYLYTGELGEDIQNVGKEILKLSFELKHPKLCNICCQQHPDVVTFNNFEDLFVFAEENKLVEVRKLCMEFLVKNKSVVEEKINFLNLFVKHPTLCSSVVQEWIESFATHFLPQNVKL